MIWAQLLAYVTGTVDQELLLRNEYLALTGRDERPWRKWLEQPNPIRFWAGIPKKFDGSRFRQRVGRPRIAEETERVSRADGKRES
jgi:hypothetical protein